MKVLSIETSCDETAVSLVEATGDFPDATYQILGNALRSQIELHRAYGGVYPSLAKRDHAAIIVTLLESVLQEAGIEATGVSTPVDRAEIEMLLSRESGLAEMLIAFHESNGVPPVDLIAVTTGPGLEPALWVGLNFAKALALLWNVPVVPVNHLEGHILASLYEEGHMPNTAFPALALIVSGGHTEFLLMHNWHEYEKVGQTRDDAVGEAFDKVARLLGLPYPGGPEIGKLAAEARAGAYPSFLTLPRPMIDSSDLDVSFSGIKTAVRYGVAEKTLSEQERASVAREFEDAVIDVLLKKSIAGIERYGVRALIVGGGVSANRRLREVFHEHFSREYPDLALYIPEPSLTTDNSIMIALGGHAHAASALSPQDIQTVRAEGNKQHRRIAVGKNPFQTTL